MLLWFMIVASKLGVKWCYFNSRRLTNRLSFFLSFFLSFVLPLLFISRVHLADTSCSNLRLSDISAEKIVGS